LAQDLGSFFYLRHSRRYEWEQMPAIHLAPIIVAPQNLGDGRSVDGRAHAQVQARPRDQRQEPLKEQVQEEFTIHGQTQGQETLLPPKPWRTLEHDITVRKGASYEPTLDSGGTKGGGGRDGSGKGRGGCFGWLCGGQSISAVDGVDDVDNDDGGGGLHDRYVIGKLLGRGQYGSVRMATQKVLEGHGGDGKSGRDLPGASGGGQRAVKSVAGDGSKSSVERIRDEVETMMAVSGCHPNLPTIFSIFEQRSRHIVHMVTEAYVGGKLLDAIGERKRFTVGDWEALAVQLLGGVSFMHMLGVVHRDIKPDNIMLKREWHASAPPSLVLVDFGSATFARGGKKLTGYEGTKFFAAPEVFQSRPYDAKAVNPKP